MRKAIFLTILILLFVTSAFATTSTAGTTLSLSAYKEVELPDMSYTITISDYSNASISGVTSVYDISNKMASSRTLTKAFYITIKSNLKANIPVVIEFTPLINQKDNLDKVPITYSFTTSTTRVTGSETIRVNNSNVVVNSGGTKYHYRYTPSLTLTDGATSVAVGESGASTTMTQAAGTIERVTVNKWGMENGRWGSATIPQSDSGTLPGLGTASSQVMSSTGYFALTIAEDDYTNMASNIDYISTVKLTITAL